MILNLYGEKIINASSVGFIPFKWNEIPDDEKENIRRYGREFIDQELLELSGCAVPCNPNALQNALKSFTGKNFKPSSLIKCITGEEIMPDPENKDDILEEIESKGVEFEDETTPIMIQVSDKIENKEVEEVEEDEIGCRSKPKLKPKEIDPIEESYTTLKEYLDIFLKTIQENISQSFKTMTEEIKSSLTNLQVKTNVQKVSATDVILGTAFEKSNVSDKVKPQINSETVKSLGSALKELRTAVDSIKQIKI
jgi:hypothetical protein